MSNSRLVGYTHMSPNHSGARKYPITRITPHFMDGDLTVESCGSIFASPSRQASSNYGIGSDGRVALYVDEANRAWTSGNADNDNRAVTIECANKSGGRLTDACWNSLVELCADICRRNGIRECTYTGDARGTLTMHKWFQDTDCPGPWLSGQFGRLVSEVNAKLNGGNVSKVSIADVAARIHYDMVTDERNGYSQAPTRWGGDYGGTKTLTINGRQYTYKLGSYDCSSSVITAWRLALQGTPYQGKLDAATYTGDMRKVFVNSGLFTASLTAAKRGDLYLAEGKHVAMCQDGGSDGVFGYDCLSEFNRNENHGATYGKPGDQDGYESVIRGYYDDGWNTVLHYNGKADYEKSTGGIMRITPHCQTFGWRNTVTEADVVGTTGQSKALEGLRFELPEGVEFELWVHAQKVGDIYYHRVAKGLERFVFGSANAAIGMEAIKFHVTVNTNPATKGKTLQYRAHIQGKGWLPWVSDGEWAGTRGESKRLEAFQCRWV